MCFNRCFNRLTYTPGFHYYITNVKKKSKPSFTNKEIKLIRKTWKSTGNDLQFYFFNAIYETNFNFFPTFILTMTRRESYCSSDITEQHLVLILESFKQLIGLLEDMGGFEEKCQEIVRHHKTYRVEFGDFIDIFNGLDLALLAYNKSYRKRCRRAFQKFLITVYQTMEVEYENWEPVPSSEGVAATILNSKTKTNNSSSDDG